MFQIKKIFAVAVVASLGACSSPPEHMSSSSDPEAIVDTAPGVHDGSEGGLEDGSGVEVLPLNSGAQSGGYGSGENMDSDPMKNFQEVDMFEPVIYFELDQYELTDENTKVIKHFAQEMLNNERLTVKIKGHTDERGTPEYNLALGERRAKSVAEAMMLFGVAESRIEVISYGEEMPVAFESNEAAWQKNRRAELEIR
ncbi:MAG: peptidoglycan-associated lipoprotein Pal [Thiomicrorhabdus sp.]|nr:peptidoglycan-associated lipoprotein Pal [Thiomicrorhabdus sp.]